MEDCSKCCHCSPELYWTTVDYEYLKMVLEALITLQNTNPKMVAQGLIDITENKMDEALETGEKSSP